MPSIGIMQGRLSAPKSDHMQTFPYTAWRDEFDRAKAVGFDAIEWLFEATQFQKNPLWSESGRAEIAARTRETGIKVNSVCAHFLIQSPPFGGDAATIENAASILNALVENAALTGIQRIIVPLVEEASLKLDSTGASTALLDSALELAQKQNMTLAFEIDLDARATVKFLERWATPSARLCYDTGNATFLGRDIVEELEILKEWVAEIHIKDRLVGGASQRLGRGDTAFPSFANALAKSEIEAPLILETPAGELWRENATAHFGFVHKTFSLE